VTPAKKKVIKEEKNQGFKRQNYYYNNRNNYGRRNSFSGYSHNIDASTYQLAQAIQKISDNNQFFPKGERIMGSFSPNPKQLPAYIPRKLLWKRQRRWRSWK
jgi:hypothetical protein